jgi:hypothetical protein
LDGYLFLQSVVKAAAGEIVVSVFQRQNGRAVIDFHFFNSSIVGHDGIDRAQVLFERFVEIKAARMDGLGYDDAA